VLAEHRILEALVARRQVEEQQRLQSVPGDRPPRRLQHRVGGVEPVERLDEVQRLVAVAGSPRHRHLLPDGPGARPPPENPDPTG
jgi:hypothetical protein